MHLYMKNSFMNINLEYDKIVITSAIKQSKPLVEDQWIKF